MSRQIESPPLPDNMISLSWTLRPLCLLKGRNLWTYILSASIFRSVPSVTFCNCCWWITPSLSVESRALQRSQEQSFISPSRESNVQSKRTDYGAKYFVIFYVLIHRFRIYVCFNPLAYDMLPPIWCGSHLRGIQNVIDPLWNFDRHVAVHLPEALPTRTLKTIFDATPP